MVIYLFLLKNRLEQNIVINIVLALIILNSINDTLIKIYILALFKAWGTHFIMCEGG